MTQSELFDMDIPLLDRFRPDGFSIELVSLARVRGLYLHGHYLRRARVGRQLNYAVLHGRSIVGAVCYALPMMRTGYLGLTSTQIVEFARLFLSVNVKGLAVWAIAQTLRRVRRDWAQSFPSADALEMVVSWHDTTIHTGTVYKAANFVFYRLSSPRRRGPLRFGAAFRGTRAIIDEDLHVKGTWFYPLTKRAKGLLRQLHTES